MTTHSNSCVSRLTTITNRYPANNATLSGDREQPDNLRRPKMAPKPTGHVVSPLVAMLVESALRIVVMAVALVALWHANANHNYL
jgi:hypothetical protein